MQVRKEHNKNKHSYNINYFSSRSKVITRAFSITFKKLHTFISSVICWRTKPQLKLHSKPPVMFSLQVCLNRPFHSSHFWKAPEEFMFMSCLQYLIFSLYIERTFFAQTHAPLMPKSSGITANTGIDFINFESLPLSPKEGV